MANEKELAKASSHMSRTERERERKVGMSCAECRRSKLKCDRTFPCSACIRRGCANICPDGTLTATKGNKVLQTQNETLLQSVKRLSTRVRELESALSKTQAQISPQPHPLLEKKEAPDEIDTSTYEEEEQTNEAEEAADLIGSLSIGDQGRARFHGQSSASEFLQTLLPGSNDDPQPALHSQNMYKMGLPLYIIDLINAFPFNAVTPDPEAKFVIPRFFPDHNKAVALALLYFEHAGCSYQVIQRDIFMPELFEVLLQTTKGVGIGEKMHAHQIAVIYLVLAIGAHICEDADGKADGEKFYLLACAAMSLSPIIKEATSASLQALFAMVQYFNCVDSPACERRWLLSGVMYRLAYSIGLQRDPALWKLSHDEIQLRRTLFWEIYTWDAWNSIIYGRPPSMNINYTDCRFPEDTSEIYNSKGEKEMGFHAYKHRFAAFIFAPVVNHIFGVRQLNYSAVLDVDMKLRKLPPPSWLLAPTRGKGEPVDGRSWKTNGAMAMQQYSILCYREATLLYIHRRYFATAIKLNGSDPLKTKYGASVMAVCRSACLLLSTLRSLYGAHPCLASKQPFFWSGAFSSIIVLGCLVFHAPGCSLANDALRAIEDGVELYSMRLFEDNSPSVKLLSSVRDTVRYMFNDYPKKDESGHAEIVMSHGPSCATMRILEGSTVLINLNEVKPQSSIPCVSFSDASSPSANSEPSSEESRERGATSSQSDWSASGPSSSASTGAGSGSGNEPSPDFQMLSFSGMHYAPDPVSIQQAPTFVTAPTVYAPLDTVAEEQAESTTTSTVPLEPGALQGNLQTAQDGTVYPFPAAGFASTEQPTMQQPTMQDAAALPAYSAPVVQYDPMTGVMDLNILNPNGYVAQGVEMYDQASWERFLNEMGMPYAGAGV